MLLWRSATCCLACRSFQTTWSRFKFCSIKTFYIVFYKEYHYFSREVGLDSFKSFKYVLQNISMLLYLCVYICTCITKVTKSLLTRTSVARELSSSQNSLDKSYFEAFLCYKKGPTIGVYFQLPILKMLFIQRGKQHGKWQLNNFCASSMKMQCKDALSTVLGA